MLRPSLLAALTAATLLCSCNKVVNVQPTIFFVTPESGSTVNSSSVFLTVGVTNFTLSGGPDTETPFVGHWHLFVDNFPPITVYSTSAAVAELGPGEHFFFAQLADQNDAPVIGTPVAQTVLEFSDTAPEVEFFQPLPDSIHQSSSVQAEVLVGDFALGQSGFYQIFLGGLDPSQLLQEGSTQEVIVSRLNPDGTDPNVQLWVALTDATSKLLDPPVFDFVNIVVPGSSPRVQIVSPARGAVIGTNFSLQVSSANWTLVDDSAGVVANAPLQGHLRVLVDGSQQGYAFASSSGGWTVTPGAHQLEVDLVDNSNQELSPAVVDQASITVE